jgi:phage/plasmid-associated DNA primase
LHRLRQQWRFTESTKGKDAILEYREETNPARSFLLQSCELASAGSIVFCADLYAAYCKWCKANGYHSLGERRFGKEVRRVFAESGKGRGTSRTDKRYYYFGIVFSGEESGVIETDLRF